ncbi:hypothetical protein [Collimonas sp.]|jgi:hypothetical protein|uniref:hypothetical protein n=1 Tax=Collimonas sp. TaxID=1963772 RepID=UPI0037C0756F
MRNRAGNRADVSDPDYLILAWGLRLRAGGQHTCSDQRYYVDLGINLHLFSP